MMARVEIVVSSGLKGVLMALFDSGCMRCVISPQVVEKLGKKLRKLRQPMAFSQLDGSIMGRVPKICLTEPVKLKAGAHIETIHLIVVPRMTKLMVLELTW